MPPKIKVSKEKILEAAFNLTRKYGVESVNARSIANETGSSTQPIFRVYSNMEELKEDLFKYIENYYNQIMISEMGEGDPFRSLGNSYIKFAKTEPNLFKMIFMTNNYKVKSFEEMLEDEENIEILKLISTQYEISIDQARKLHIQIWLFTHGIASMISTNNCSLDYEEIDELVCNAFEAFLKNL